MVHSSYKLLPWHPKCRLVPLHTEGIVTTLPVETVGTMGDGSGRASRSTPSCLETVCSIFAVLGVRRGSTTELQVDIGGACALRLKFAVIRNGIGTPDTCLFEPLV
jgi:hypothetical protein